MTWIDALDDNRFLRSLYPSHDPSLDHTRLHEVQLRHDGPAIWLRFDLDEYPTHPPKKWVAGGCTTVQVRLMGIGIEKLKFEGWTSKNVGRLVVRKNVQSIDVEFHAAGCEVRLAVEHLRVDHISAYQDAALVAVPGASNE
jgi:hypothetical protein